MDNISKIMKWQWITN